MHACAEHACLNAMHVCSVHGLDVMCVYMCMHAQMGVYHVNRVPMDAAMAMSLALKDQVGVVLACVCMHMCYKHAHVLQTCVQAHALMRIRVPMQACSMGMHMQLHTQAWLGRPHLHVRMYTYLRPHLHVCMEVVKCAHALHHSEMCTWITQCKMHAGMVMPPTS